jgi:hypothetical protein
MRIQSIYSDGWLWEGSTDLPESRAHELSAALVGRVCWLVVSLRVV